MKTKNIILSLFIGSTLLTTSCTDGFDAINTNKTNPTEDMYDFSKSDLGGVLWDGSTYNVSKNGAADLHQRVKALGYDIFAQYVLGNSVRKYTPNDGYLTNYWNSHYNNYMAPLNTIIRDAEEYGGRENSMALARIWRVYLQSRFIDFYGPAPFPKSPEDTNPDYQPLDQQFAFFFSELDAAVKQFDKTADFLSVEDQIFWGNITKWQRFANTLRLRLAMQVSEINPELCKEQAQAALNAPEGIMQAGDDARVKMQPPGSWGNQYPYYMYQVSWSDRQSLTTTMEKVLTGIGGIEYKGKATVHPKNLDPRGDRMFDPGLNGVWAGIKPGYAEDATATAAKANSGTMSTTWIIPNDRRNTDILLYAEACFLAAEATERFSVASSKNAKAWYEDGVKASFGYLSLGADIATTYLSSTDKNGWGTSANYDDDAGTGNTKLEKIITQKYIAAYPDVSAQAWNDKRRLNLPAFDIPETRDAGAGTYPTDNNIKNPSNYISRMVYPQGEALINKAKYDAGVAQLTGGDKTSSTMWWASKKSNYVTSN